MQSHWFTRLGRNPAHLGTLSRTANVLISEHRFAEAQVSLEALRAAHPDDAALCFNLGLALYYQQRWGDALAAFDAARERGLEDAELLRYRTFTLHHLGRLDEAVDACEAWARARRRIVRARWRAASTRTASAPRGRVSQSWRSTATARGARRC